MLEPRHRTAFAGSGLGVLPDETLEALAAGSTFVDVPAGGVFLRLGPKDPFVCVAIEGLIRVFLVSPDGRQMTVRYSRPGDIVGATALYTRPLLNISVQAITDCRVLVLHVDTVVSLAKTDVALANVLLVDLAERASGYIHALASTTLSSLKQNVVRHVLDLAAADQQDHRLVARLSQQELANHVGTVREVVGRILRDLKEQGPGVDGSRRDRAARRRTTA